MLSPSLRFVRVTVCTLHLPIRLSGPALLRLLFSFSHAPLLSIPLTDSIAEPGMVMHGRTETIDNSYFNRVGGTWGWVQV